MAYVLDPICISTEGEVTPTGLQDFALSTAGIVCRALDDGIGGDPEGAWERIRRQYERRLKTLKRTVTTESITGELAELDVVLEEFDAEADELRGNQLQDLPVDELVEFVREAEKKETLIFLEAVRSQRRLQELELAIALARKLRDELDEELALVLALTVLLHT